MTEEEAKETISDLQKEVDALEKLSEERRDRAKEAERKNELLKHQIGKIRDELKSFNASANWSSLGLESWKSNIINLINVSTPDPGIPSCPHCLIVRRIYDEKDSERIKELESLQIALKDRNKKIKKLNHKLEGLSQKFKETPFHELLELARIWGGDRSDQSKWECSRELLKIIDHSLGIKPEESTQTKEAPAQCTCYPDERTRSTPKCNVCESVPIQQEKVDVEEHDETPIASESTTSERQDLIASILHKLDAACHLAKISGDHEESHLTQIIIIRIKNILGIK